MLQKAVFELVQQFYHATETDKDNCSDKVKYRATQS